MAGVLAHTPHLLNACQRRSIRKVVGTQAMEAERTRVSVARERAVVVHQEAQTEHKRAVMMVCLLQHHSYIITRSCMKPILYHDVSRSIVYEELRVATGRLRYAV